MAGEYWDGPLAMAFQAKHKDSPFLSTLTDLENAVKILSDAGPRVLEAVRQPHWAAQAQHSSGY